jgi:hypothetical protein
MIQQAVELLQQLLKENQLTPTDWVTLEQLLSQHARLITGPRVGEREVTQFASHVVSLFEQVEKLKDAAGKLRKPKPTSQDLQPLENEVVELKRLMAEIKQKAKT